MQRNELTASVWIFPKGGRLAALFFVRFVGNLFCPQYPGTSREVNHCSFWLQPGGKP